MSDSKFLDNEGLDYYTERLVAYLQSLSWPSSTGVESFAGRSGSVEPQSGDYTADMVGAVPTTRTVNGKALSSDITLTASDVGALSSTGTATAATKLATARTIRTNLASTSTASFNGTANITPGVTGTLSIANGGTGGTTASEAVGNLIQPLDAMIQNNVSSLASSNYIPLVYNSKGYKTTVEALIRATTSLATIYTLGTGSATEISFVVPAANRTTNLFIFGYASIGTSVLVPHMLYFSTHLNNGVIIQGSKSPSASSNLTGSWNSTSGVITINSSDDSIFAKMNTSGKIIVFIVLGRV